MDHKSGVKDKGAWQDWPADRRPREELPVPYGFRTPGHGGMRGRIEDATDSLPSYGSRSIGGASVVSSVVSS